MLIAQSNHNLIKLKYYHRPSSYRDYEKILTTSYINRTTPDVEDLERLVDLDGVSEGHGPRQRQAVPREVQNLQARILL